MASLNLGPEQIALGSGSITAIALAIGAFMGKQMTASALKRIEDRHRSELLQIEETHQSELRRIEEAHRVAIEASRALDTDLRARRIAVYEELWSATGLLPKWPRATITGSQLLDFSKQLRDWYFNGGGMYLSHSARNAYGNVQDAIASVLSRGADGTLNGEQYEAIRSACSQLRSEMTTDIESRRPGPVGVDSGV